MNAAVTIGTLMRDQVKSDEAAGRTNDLSSLDILGLGEQALSRAVMAWFEDSYGSTVVQGYGMTECSPQSGFFAMNCSLPDPSRDGASTLRHKQGPPIPLMQTACWTPTETISP